MTKRLVRAGIGLATLLVAVPQQARPSAYTVEPCLKSKLCSGLVEHFNMQDVGDYARYGAFGSVLHENVGFNVGSTTGQFGNAANFSASTDYLWSSTFVPNMASYWSASFWFNASSLPASGQNKYFFGRNATGNSGTSVFLNNTAGTTKVCVTVINRDGTSASVPCHTTAISASTKYFVAVGVGDPDDTPGGLQAWISINGGAKQATTLNFIPWSGLSHFRVGQEPTNGKASAGTINFTGWIDELSIFNRSIGPTDIALLCNDLGAGCTGRAYPFVTE